MIEIIFNLGCNDLEWSKIGRICDYRISPRESVSDKSPVNNCGEIEEKEFNTDISVKINEILDSGTIIKHIAKKTMKHRNKPINKRYSQHNTGIWEEGLNFAKIG
jgi:hypothetical protein